MSVLKVKVILEAYYDQEKLSWILTGGNREYLKVEDGVSVESAKNWETFPERINITAVEGMEFKTNVVPQPQEGQTEPTTLTLEKVFPLKDPQGLQWDMADLEADNCSGRNQLGEYFRDVVDRKVTLSAAWGALTDDEIAELLDNIKDDSFLLEYPDAKEGKRMTIKVYVSSRTAPMYNYTKNDGEIRDRWMWQGLSVSFTEV